MLPGSEFSTNAYVDINTGEMIGGSRRKKRQLCLACCSGCVTMALVLFAAVLIITKAFRDQGWEFGIVQIEDDGLDPLPIIDDDGGFVVPKEPYTDSMTGVVHPAIIRAGNMDHELMVLGAGPLQQTVSSVTINAYSVAMYVDPVRARQDFQDFEGLSAVELRAMPEFFDSLRDSSFDKAMRIIIKYAVSREEMLSGLSEPFSASLTRQGAGDRTDELLDILASLLIDMTYTAGDELVFSLTNGGFSLSVNSDTGRAVIEGDTLFNEAFFGIYTDAESPAPKARERYPDRAPLLWLRGDIEFKLVQNQNLVERSTAPVDVSVTVHGHTSQAMYTGMSTQNSGSMFGSKQAEVALYVDTVFTGLHSAADFSAVTLLDMTYATHNHTRVLRFKMLKEMVGTDFVSIIVDAMSGTLDTLMLGDPARIDNAKRNFRNLFPFTLRVEDVFYIACSRDQDMGMVVHTINENELVRPLLSEYSLELCAGLFEVYVSGSSILSKRTDLATAWP